MPRQKTKTMWVIFASPQQVDGPNRYFAKDGKVTTIPKLAAKFVTFGDAEGFAEARGIKLSATQYIGHDDFQESDL